MVPRLIRDWSTRSQRWIDRHVQHGRSIQFGLESARTKADVARLAQLYLTWLAHALPLAQLHENSAAPLPSAEIFVPEPAATEAQGPYTRRPTTLAKEVADRLRTQVLQLEAYRPSRRNFVNPANLTVGFVTLLRSEEHTSELQSPCNLVCRLLLDQI